MFAAKLREHAVFSAHAEVVPKELAHDATADSILRARGGSSAMGPKPPTSYEYSPRTRR